LRDKGTKNWWLWATPLVLVVAVAVWILPSLWPTAAITETQETILEPIAPVDWRDTLAASGVLHSRALQLLVDGAGMPEWRVDGNRLIIRTSDESITDVLVAESGRVGRVELVEGGTEFLPIGALVVTGVRPDPQRNVYQSVLASEHFAEARAEMGRNGKPLISFSLTPTGADLFSAHTAAQQGYYLCLVVDGQVANCPVIRAPLVEGRGVMEFISNVTMEQAKTYAMLLCSGPMPVTFRRVDG
jgi:hypothetical protein